MTNQPKAIHEYFMNFMNINVLDALVADAVEEKLFG